MGEGGEKERKRGRGGCRKTYIALESGRRMKCAAAPPRAPNTSSNQKKTEKETKQKITNNEKQ